jgi:hypothetical protein
MRQVFTLAAAFVFAMLSNSVIGKPMTLNEVQQRWANINYNMQGDEKITAFELLIEDTYELAQNGDIELLIWHGITQSTMAGSKKGIGALKHAKAAKKAFEKALKTDETALNGSALTSLGVLYHKVPGWPIGFGNEDKAEELMLKSIKISPQGIDQNYFYAEYLFDHEKFKDAKVYASLAQQAAPRPTRPLADAGRQQEIFELLQKIESEL